MSAADAVVGRRSSRSSGSSTSTLPLTCATSRPCSSSVTTVMRLRSLSKGSSRTHLVRGGDRLAVMPALGREREERALGRIADDLPALVSASMLEVRVVAERRGREQCSRAAPGISATVSPPSSSRKAPARIVALAGHACSARRRRRRRARSSRSAVSVPVLSVQMIVAAPSVSTAGSLRTIAPRFAMRCMPSASVMVVIAGQALGDGRDREAHRLEQELVPRRDRRATCPSAKQHAR